MNPNEYQIWARTTAIYPDAQTGSMAELMYLGLGLGEAGEVQGKIKKMYRDGLTRSQISDIIIAELGDVLWYTARLTDELGVNLSEVFERNMQKLDSRKERGQLQGSGDSR